MDSILDSIKKLLGISKEDTNFDTDIIIHINTVIMGLRQMGVGPKEGFAITDNSTEWTEFIEDVRKVEAVRSYIYFKVRLMFDPPSSSTATQAINDCINELEWRLNSEVDYPVD